MCWEVRLCASAPTLACPMIYLRNRKGYRSRWYCSKEAIDERSLEDVKCRGIFAKVRQRRGKDSTMQMLVGLEGWDAVCGG